LGSYPIAGPDAVTQQQDATEALLAARSWIADVRAQVETDPTL